MKLKKILAGALAGATVFAAMGSMASAYSERDGFMVHDTESELYYTVNGEKVGTGTLKPIVFSNPDKTVADQIIMMLPIREIAETLGFKVDWDDENKTVILQDNERLVLIPTNVNEVYVNGELKSLTCENPVIKDDRTYVDINSICEIFGFGGAMYSPYEHDLYEGGIITYEGDEIPEELREKWEAIRNE